jgi:uncharacterized membrane protein
VIIIVALLTAVLMGIALLHLAWGLGVRWPVKDEAALAATVIGFRGQTRMPAFLPCLAVAIALAAVTTLVFWQAQSPALLPRTGLLAATAVFLARGVAAYVPAWRRLTPQEPFARLDRTLYGPLCLLLAAGLAVVALGVVA